MTRTTDPEQMPVLARLRHLECTRYPDLPLVLIPIIFT